MNGFASYSCYFYISMKNDEEKEKNILAFDHGTKAQTTK